ncbi:MAG: hypothetical protein II719_01600, partial [Clostridia bacterium]|nr:hypothetical protein [Clostridia bacterium]
MERYFSEPMTLEEGAAPSTYTLRLTDDQAAVFAKANYYILSRFGDGAYSLVYCSNDVTLEGTWLTAHFDGRIFYYESDFGQVGIPFTRMWDTVEGVTDYTVMNVVLTRGEEFGAGEDKLGVEIPFSVRQDTGEMTIKGIFPSLEDEGAFSGGKQETVDLAEWDVIRFYNVEPRFLIRDESGRIPYFWNWPKNGWITRREVPVADNPHFSFKPLYDDGTEYYILINVMDVQGNLYTSELFPVDLAQAPEKEALPSHTVVWSEGESVELWDANSIRLTLQTELTVDNAGERYTLSAENRNDFPVIVSLGGAGTILNDKVDCGEYNLAYFSLEPGETQTAGLSFLSRNLFLSGEERLRSLSCPCSIFRYDNYATLFEGTLDLDVPSPLRFAVRWDPLLSALAEPQQIFENEGLQVRVLHLGSPSDSGYYYGNENSLIIQLGFENQSGSPRDLVLDGFLVNGCFMPVGRGLRLGDGENWYPTTKAGEVYLRSLFYEGIFWLKESSETLPSLDSISDVAVCLTIDGQYYRCPVSLALHGNDPPIVPDGDLLYEDDEIEIWLSEMRMETSYSETRYPVWRLWAVNRGDATLDLFCKTSKPYPHAGSSGLESICPGGVVFFTIYDSSHDDEVLSFTLISSGGYASESIQLPPVTR